MAGGTVQASGQLSNGRVIAQANASNLGISRFVPNYDQPIALIRGRAQVAAPLTALLNLTATPSPSFSGLNAAGTAEVRIADGTVLGGARLDNNRWQAEVVARNLNTTQLNRQFPLLDRPQLALPNLNARFDLAGSLIPSPAPASTPPSAPRRSPYSLGNRD
ncbi:MAG: hypothetical protein HC890_05880 [Chloroflexaceae bacterium]|nr:hypothetical protein [Chloroflexaceae bacterium]